MSDAMTPVSMWLGSAGTRYGRVETKELDEARSQNPEIDHHVAVWWDDMPGVHTYEPLRHLAEV
ncbi:hypothetical protein [Catenuloplanes japonicus]|uniref:hypothetical protein n=1 Tax=Catenuloplanes japonicus TaxID=33876 RepID=UPI000525141B|nr:hypothetical protein [Catenuloplanes japonicus]